MVQYGYSTVTPQAQIVLPVVRACFDEATACFINIAYFDTTDNPFTPAAAKYRIDDQTSGEPIVPWTQLTPGTSNQATVTSAQNAMLSLTRAFETHQITVQITDSAGNVFYAGALFDIRRTFGPVPGNTAGGDWPAGSSVTAGS